MSLIRNAPRRLLVVAFECIVVLLASSVAALAVTTPPTPTAFSGSASVGSVTLRWRLPAGIVGVDVLRNGILVAKKVRGTRWTTTSVRNGITYRYAVRGVDARGRNSRTTVARSLTPLAAPPAPIGVALRNQDRQATVTWKPPANSLAATVRLVLDGSTVASVAAASGSAVAAHLVNGRSYLLGVQAVNRNGSPSRTVFLTAVPTSDQQRSPLGLTATGGDARVDLAWLPVAGAQSYTVYRDGKVLGPTAASTPKTADTGLVNGVSHGYQVRVLVAGQMSGLSPVRAATPLAVPGAVDSLTAQAHDGAATLSWSAPTGSVAAYELFRDDNVVADLPGTATTYADSGLSNGHPYRYTLIGRNANGATGPASAAVSVVPAPPPPTPSALAAGAGDSQVTLSWSPITGIERWVLLRDGTPLGGVLTGTTFLDTSALNGVTYAYALIAVAPDNQQSLPSPAVTAVPRAVAPQAPTGVTADAGDTAVTLTWQMPDPAPARYRVYRDGARVAETATSPLRDGALDNGTAYRYTVTAVDGRGVESAASEPVTAMPVSPGPDAPTLRAQSGHEEARLTLAAATGKTAADWRVFRDGVLVRTGTGDELTARELTDGQVYRFQAQARYADGTSSPLSPVVVVVPHAPWRGVAVGAAFACAVHVDGGVRCWGANDSGQLGDGSAVAGSAGPVVASGPTGVSRVAAGDRHACAVGGDGKLWCWGAAPGAPGGPGRPTTVAGLSGVTAVGAGGATTCAVASGDVWCFGDGSAGQLGGTASSATPVRIALPATAVDVAVGGRHACALLADTTVACWGADEHGQRSGTPSAARTPVRVANLTGVTAVSAGADHTCVLAGTAVSCFGAGDAGQLGRPADDGAGAAAVDVPPAVAVSAGNRYTCVTLLTGQARCFGAGGAGQLGDGTGRDRSEPVAVLNLDSATTVVAGAGATTCALTRDGSLWCFGANGSGQIGAGTLALRSQPSDPIVGLTGAVSVAMGDDASCIIRAAAVWCWGPNQYGGVGSDPGLPAPRPVQVPLPSGVVPRTLAVGTATVCVTSTVNELYCWGADDAGQAGAAPARTVGVTKVPLTSVADVAVGQAATCARRSGGTLWCFGSSGLLGAGLTGTQPHPVPAQVLGTDGSPLTEVALLTAGDRHTCAVKHYSTSSPQSGGVWCFGDEGQGRLGSTGTGGLATPVPGLTAVISIAAGRAHTCAVSLAPDRALQCFGANGAGQLGLGDTTDRTTPTVVPDMTASRVVAAGDVTCVKSPNPQGWCFGAGARGQTGDGLLRDAEPVPQVVYDSGGILLAAAFATNGSTSCALLTSGAVSCWGARTLTSYGEGPAYGYPVAPVVD